MKNSINSNEKSAIVLGDIRFFEKTRRGQELKPAFDKYLKKIIKITLGVKEITKDLIEHKINFYIDDNNGKVLKEMKDALKSARGGNFEKLENILVAAGFDEIIVDTKVDIAKKLYNYRAKFICKR